MYGIENEHEKGKDFNLLDGDESDESGNQYNKHSELKDERDVARSLFKKQ